jgi:pimeloyl-ACP methyl ester carboxylesterase
MLDLVDSGGSSSALVLLHAAGTAPSYFDPIIAALSGEIRCVAIRTPGYPPNAAISPYSLERAQVEIESTLAEIGVERCVAVGHSAGGYRALKLALDGRVRVDALALLAPFAGAAPAQAEQLRALAGGLRSGQATLPDVFVQTGLLRARHDSGAVDDIRGYGRRAAIAVVADELEAFAAAPDLVPLVAALQIEALVRVGSEDVSTPTADVVRLAHALPSAQLEIVEGVAHSLLHEDRAATIESVRSFVRALSR